MTQAVVATTFQMTRCADGLRFLCPRMRMAVKIRLILIYSPRHIRPDCPLVSHQARYIICCLISFYCGFALLLSCGLAWVSLRFARPFTVVFKLLSFKLGLLPICFARPSTVVFRLMHHKLAWVPIFFSAHYPYSSVVLLLIMHQRVCEKALWNMNIAALIRLKTNVGKGFFALRKHAKRLDYEVILLYKSIIVALR